MLSLLVVLAARPRSLASGGEYQGQISDRLVTGKHVKVRGLIRGQRSTAPMPKCHQMFAIMLSIQPRTTKRICTHQNTEEASRDDFTTSTKHERTAFDVRVDP